MRREHSWPCTSSPLIMPPSCGVSSVASPYKRLPSVTVPARFDVFSIFWRTKPICRRQDVTVDAHFVTFRYRAAGRPLRPRSPSADAGEQRLPGEMSLQIVDDELAHSGAGGVRGAPDMRQQDHMLHAKERFRHARLVREDIEA